jgi:prenyltransferase beta subunit
VARVIPRHDPGLGSAILARLESWRCADGGYRLHPDGVRGSAYASLVACLAYEELGVLPPPSTVGCLTALRSADGGFGDRPGMASGTTTVTAAAALLLCSFGHAVDHQVASWLKARRTASGGFLASPLAPLPDLLSTATAMVALARLGQLDGGTRNAVVAFVEDHWDQSGGFVGHLADSQPDCEYTYYALLSLGIAGGGE